MPQYLWVAVGGKSQLGDKVEVLDGRTILAIPDIDGQEAWIEKINERPYLNIQITDFLIQEATDEELSMGADVADLLIRWKTSPESRDHPDDENPILTEIRRYFSPQYVDEVMDLVEDLDLEIVGVTGRIE